ncbi:unnamed protein product, partial [marine sediment metagenome]
TVNHSSGTQYKVRGVSGSVNQWSDGILSNAIGGNFDVATQAAVTGNITIAKGVSGSVKLGNTNTATILSATSFNAGTMDAEDGTITTGYSFYGSAPAVDDGTFGTFYNLYLENPTAANTNWSIYSAGGASLLNAGTATVVPFTVKGAASQSANLQEWQDSNGARLTAINSIGSILFPSIIDIRFS